jgi:hypothetical protein
VKVVEQFEKLLPCSADPPNAVAPAHLKPSSVPIIVQKRKKMTLGWVVDGEKTPHWAARGIDPPQPSRYIDTLIH